MFCNFLSPSPSSIYVHMTQTHQLISLYSVLPSLARVLNSSSFTSKVIQRAVLTTDEYGNDYYLHEDPTATVHMVIGTGGAMFSKNAVDPPPAWNELYFYEYGYARVTAQDASTLKWEWVNSETSQVMDTMVITQSSRTSYISGTSESDTLTEGEKAAITVCLLFAFGLLLYAWYNYYYRKTAEESSTSTWRTRESRSLSEYDANNTVSALHQKFNVSHANPLKETSPIERLL